MTFTPAGNDVATFFGLQVVDGWSSDSKDTTQLDQVCLSEVVQIVQSGSFAGGNVHTSRYIPANPNLGIDNHMVSSGKTAIGSSTAHQVSIIADRRTGAYNIAMSDSGFTITEAVLSNGSGGLQLTVTKTAADQTNVGDGLGNQYSSNKGATIPDPITVTMPYR